MDALKAAAKGRPSKSSKGRRRSPEEPRDAPKNSEQVKKDPAKALKLAKTLSKTLSK